MAAGPLGPSGADKLFKAVRGMVTPFTALPTTKCSQVPSLFFKTLLHEMPIAKSVEHALMKVVPKRELRFEGNKASHDALVTMRVTRAVQFVRVLVEDAYVFGWRGFSEGELVEQAIRWLVLDWCGVAIKQVKTHLVWLSGRQRGVVAPVEGLIDLPGMLLTPKYRAWLLQRLTSRSHQVIGEVLSETALIGTKRGFPSVEDDLVEEEGRTYAKQMRVVAPLADATVVVRGETIQLKPLVTANIQNVSGEVFGSRQDPGFVPFSVSQRAGYAAPIFQGGILGWWLRNFPDIRSTEQLVKMVEFNGRVFEVRGYLVDSSQVWNLTKNIWCNSRKDGKVGRNVHNRREGTVWDTTTWGDFRKMEGWTGMDADLSTPEEVLACCQVYFIREPLKLRTITAGSPSLYGGLGPLLAHLRKGMKSFRCFALTRGVSDGQLLAEQLNQHPLGGVSGIHPFEQWDKFVSGDYKQSTNDLAMMATTLAVEEAFEGDALDLAHSALGAQMIRLPDGTSFVQARGQLMGSPLSFPFLCSINAAVAKTAYTVVHPELSQLPLDRFPMLINGDDFLARMSEEVYAVWLKCLEVVRWELSPGKSYFLSDLAQVNSETRHVHRIGSHRGQPAVGQVTRYVFSEPIPFLNGGYLHQMRKATEQINGPTVEMMSLDWQSRWKSFERLPPAVCRRAREVMSCNLRVLVKEMHSRGLTPFELNLCNPVGAGGLGIPSGAYDPVRSWLGLHCCTVRAPLASETFKVEKKIREPSPLLQWRDEEAPPPYSWKALLRILVSDLERDFVRSLEPTLQATCGWEMLKSRPDRPALIPLGNGSRRRAEDVLPQLASLCSYVSESVLATASV